MNKIDSLLSISRSVNTDKVVLCKLIAPLGSGCVYCLVFNLRSCKLMQYHLNSFISCFVIFHPLSRDTNSLTLKNTFYMGVLVCIYCISVISCRSACFEALYILFKSNILCFKFVIIFPSTFHIYAALSAHQEWVLSLSLLVLVLDLTYILTLLLS